MLSLRFVLIVALLTLPAMGAAQSSGARFELPPSQEGQWFKGNTHSHTDRSDGDSPPGVVARWYKAHGYRFLVLSDHNVFTDPKTLSHLVDSSFLLIPGEELTSSFERKPVHVNGLNIPGLIEARTDSTLVGTIQKNVDAVREARGVPHINHPNFRWAFGYEELRQVRNDKLFEIWNGHPLVHNLGGGDHDSLEDIWDRLLTDGKRLYGIAVDDAHHFQGEFAPERSNPGRGWIVVRAPRLEANALVDAMEAGQFYASTGVTIADVRVEPTRLTITIEPRGDFKYTTEFIGRGGRLLARSGGLTAAYTLRGDEGYVRARVRDSMGYHAWVQPVFVESAP
ncbi:MAG TPA: CehA/McbA family metallohydrolase [Gemmatimonadaceae bacterium]|nr:CehA/McbA family metallohydrolase [Gemmatimonadaceae bacterium]